MSEANKAVVRRFYELGTDLEAIRDLIAPDLRYHGPLMTGEFEGREGFLHLLSGLVHAFPGFTTTIEDLVAEGDLVTARHTHHAVHAGETGGAETGGRRDRSSSAS